MKPSQKPQRGASTVEFALSMLIFIPLALYAAYAGEVFQAGFRAQEAESSAGWDLTAYKMNNYSKPFTGDDMEDDPTSDGDETASFAAYADSTYEVTAMDQGRYIAAANLVAGQVRAELRAQGLMSGKRGAAGTVVMEDSDVGLKCRLLPVPSWDPAAKTFLAVPASSAMYLHRGGYVGCAAQTHFLQDVLARDYATEFSKEQLFKPNALDLKLCGLGKGIQGCTGAKTNGFIVLTNDWSLDDPRPHFGPRGASGAKNLNYWNVGASVHGAFAGAGLSTRMIRSTMAFFAEDDLDFGSENPKAFGNGSAAFKLMYGGLTARPLTQHPERMGGPQVGPTSAHTTPVDDDEPPETKFVAGQVMGARRSNSKYLGQNNANYNAGWNAGK